MGIFHSMLEEYRTSDSPISTISSAGFPDLAVSAAFEGPTRRLLIQSVTASTPASARRSEQGRGLHLGQG